MTRRRYRAIVVMGAAAIIAGAIAFRYAAGYAEAQHGESAYGAMDRKLDPGGWPSDALTIASLGHATLLMNYFGVRLVSDPTLFNRVGLSFDSILTIGPRRMVPPPLKPAQLQNLDVVLITHAHMDHLDLPSLKTLPKHAVVVACTGCGELIRPLGFKDVRELEWGQQTVIDGMTIAAMGARHWGKRWPWGRSYGYNSYVIARNGHRMLLACDSALTDLFAPLHNHPPEVAAFSIGAYDPWILHHANPEQVWRMFVATRAQYLIPIHWGTFRLSREPSDEPMRRLISAAGDDAHRIVLREIGSTWTLPSRPAESIRAENRTDAAPMPSIGNKVD